MSVLPTQSERLRSDLIVCCISGVLVFAISVSTVFSSSVLQVRQLYGHINANLNIYIVTSKIENKNKTNTHRQNLDNASCGKRFFVKKPATGKIGVILIIVKPQLMLQCCNKSVENRRVSVLVVICVIYLSFDYINTVQYAVKDSSIGHKNGSRLTSIFCDRCNYTEMGLIAKNIWSYQSGCFA